jgi:hypothetical protein
MFICVFTNKTGFQTKKTQKTVAKVRNLRTEEKPSFAYLCICVQSVTANIGSCLESVLSWFLQEFCKQICWAFWWFQEKPRLSQF